MSDPTRRRLLFSLPLAALPAGSAFALLSSLAEAAAQPPIHPALPSVTHETGNGDAMQQADGNFKGKSQNALQTDFSHCKAFPFAGLPLRYSDAGAPTHDILRGNIPTGELVELHETTIAPSKMPHPAHQHPHVEFILVREGTIDFTYQGQSHILTAGSVGYTAPNELHGFKNSGNSPATYFIFSLGKR